MKFLKLPLGSNFISVYPLHYTGLMIDVDETRVVLVTYFRLTRNKYALLGNIYGIERYGDLNEKM